MTCPTYISSFTEDGPSNSSSNNDSSNHSSFLKEFSSWVFTPTSSDGQQQQQQSYHNSSITTTTTATKSYNRKHNQMFDLRGLIVDESKSNDATSVTQKQKQQQQFFFVNALQCGSKVVGGVCQQTTSMDGEDESTTMSDNDYHMNSKNNTNYHNRSSSYNTNNYYNQADDDYEYDQMRRLASWGTFGTIGTNESLDNHSCVSMIQKGGDDTGVVSTTMMNDDDGNPINIQIYENIRNRKSRTEGTNNKKKKRVVQFAYPPISSLRQCPRIDPTDVDILFFSDEELATYERDRRSTGVIDDVEIVAVSTSLSDDGTTTIPDPKTSTTTTTTPAQQQQQQESDPTQQQQPLVDNTTINTTMASPLSGLYKTFRMTSPRPLLLRNGSSTPTNKHPARKISSSNASVASSSMSLSYSASNRFKRNKSFQPTPTNHNGGSSTSSTSFVDENHSTTVYDDHQQYQQPKEKRLLKSVQIFLRARSTA